MSPGYCRGLSLTIAGAVLISVETLILRLLATDLWTVIWWRGVLLGGVTLPILAMAGRSLALTRLPKLPEITAVVAFAASVFSFISAVHHTTVANTLVIASGAPFLAALFSWIFLGERISTATWASVLALFLGLATIFSGSLETAYLVGDLFALAYAGCLAIYFVALRNCDAGAILPIVACGGILSAVLAWPAAAPAAVAPSDLWLLLTLGGLVVPLSTALLALGTRYLPAPEITLLMMLETILGPLWVWLVVEEVPNRATIAGGTLVLVTVAVHSLLGMRRSACS